MQSVGHHSTEAKSNVPAACMHVHLLLCAPTVMSAGQELVVASFGEVALTKFEPLKLLTDIIMQN